MGEGLFVESLSCELATELGKWRAMMRCCVEELQAGDDQDCRGKAFRNEPLALRFWHRDRPVASNKRERDDNS